MLTCHSRTTRLRGSGLLAPRRRMATIACSMPASVYSRVARKRKFSTLSLRSAVENGSFSCGCQVGFSGNGFQCNDIDECLDSNDTVCDALGRCHNTFGAFVCSCRFGYTGTGLPSKCQGEFALAMFPFWRIVTSLTRVFNFFPPLKPTKWL